MNDENMCDIRLPIIRFYLCHFPLIEQIHQEIAYLFINYLILYARF